MRYPGGKYFARKVLLPFFPMEPGELCSPFFGGGSIEIMLAARGWRVHGYDAFDSLVDFWQIAITEPVALAAAAAKYLTADNTTLRSLKQVRLPSQLERAAAFYALNRASYSGATMSGGIASKRERFTPSSITRLHDFKVSELWVEQVDFRESIARHPDALIYADPPYPDAHRLYGRRGDLHEGFDHRALAEILHARNRWILSYSDCQLVRELYEGYTIVPLRWKHGMSRDKRSREVVILSHDMAEQVATSEKAVLVAV